MKKYEWKSLKKYFLAILFSLCAFTFLGCTSTFVGTDSKLTYTEQLDRYEKVYIKQKDGSVIKGSITNIGDESLTTNTLKAGEPDIIVPYKKIDFIKKNTNTKKNLDLTAKGFFGVFVVLPVTILTAGVAIPLIIGCLFIKDARDCIAS